MQIQPRPVQLSSTAVPGEPDPGHVGQYQQELFYCYFVQKLLDSETLWWYTDCHSVLLQRGSRRNAPICYDFVKGVCARGPDCRYSHDINSIINDTRHAAPNAHAAQLCHDYSK